MFARRETRTATFSAKEAKKMLEKWDEENNSNNYTVPGVSSRSAIAKIRLLNLWMLRSGSREQDFKSMPRTHHRKPTYDVDTRWNSAYDMIDQFLKLEAEYTEFVDTHPQVKCLLPSSEEIVALYQLRNVKPFKDHALKVSVVH
jgi:hypothetical protein